MVKRVEIIGKQHPYDKFGFRLEEVRLRYEKFNHKMSDEVTRVSLERGESVAGVIHNTDTDSIVLVEQFRYPSYEKGTGWLLELPAGMVKSSEMQNPVLSLKREIDEEIGYEIDPARFSPISTFYPSPGGSSERIHLFYVAVSNKDKRVNRGGGLASEGEDIRLNEIGLDDALEKIKSGEIADAKTIIGLQWVKLNLRQG
jgi:nudix-type nucleoside diphosphatase (YffH/AdpP family)